MVLGIGILFVAGLLIGLSLQRHESIMSVMVDQAVPTPQEIFGKDRLNVLIVGLDYDYNEKDEEYSSESRSDVIWAVSLDFANKKINELSVPRDTDVVLPNGQEGKINQAQSDGGIKESQAVIAKFLEIPGFDRYVILRINAAKQFIDAIGGVNINVMNSNAISHQGPNGPLDYDDTWGHLHVHLKPGMQHLNGDQAVGYMRFRHDWCSDICRIKRQQQLFHVLIAKLKGDKLNTLIHISQLIGVVNRNVQTNFTTQEEVSIANSFSGVDPKSIRNETVPYTDTKDIAAGNVLIPDENAKQKLVQSMFYAEPTPAVSPGPGVLAAIAPSSIKLDIKNGSGVPGLAGKLADQLRAKGYVIANVGNASQSDLSKTQIHEHSAVAFAGMKVRASIGSAANGVQVDSDPGNPDAPVSDVTIVIGKDLADKRVVSTP